MSSTVYKISVVAIVIIVLIIVWFSVSCEKYTPINSAQFLVNRPKYNPPNFNVPKSFENQLTTEINRYNTSCPEEKTCFTWSYGTDKSYYDYCMQKNCAGSTKESFMVPPTELKLVQNRTKMLGGSLISSSNNPFMGSLPNEAKLGVTAPQRQGPITVSLSNSGNESKALWSTIV